MAYTTIDDPSEYFQTALWTGNGVSGTAITNDGNSDLQPDLLWGKIRVDDADQLRNHWWIDSSRGINKALGSNTTSSEETNSGYLNSFDSDGFTLGSDGNSNGSGDTVVGWQWKANGGTTSSNTDGSITSTVQANTTAGFSIVTYTGTGSNATVGHGLGATPKAYIVKNRTDAADWFVYHGSLGTPVNEYLQLNNTNAVGSNSGTWNSNPTSSVFGLGSTFGALNGSSKNYVAYVFADIQGYSKFGSYEGNDATDGPFVYTGFKPAWVMIRHISGSAGGTKNWYMYDNKRSPQNVNDNTLIANGNDAESADSAFDIDMLSNGFKIRNAEGAINNAASYIYMAFAEHPFVSSKGVPVTAK